MRKIMIDLDDTIVEGGYLEVLNEYLGTNYKIRAESGGSSFDYSSENPDLAKYGNFDLAMDSFYHQENLVMII